MSNDKNPQNLVRSRNYEIPDHLGFSRHMKINVVQGVLYVYIKFPDIHVKTIFPHLCNYAYITLISFLILDKKKLMSSGDHFKKEDGG